MSQNNILENMEKKTNKPTGTSGTYVSTSDPEIAEVTKKLWASNYPPLDKLEIYFWRFFENVAHEQTRLQKTLEVELFKDRILALDKEIRALEIRALRLRTLETRLEQTKQYVKPFPRDEADEVYEKHRQQLENEHLDQIIAIDTHAKEIVGYGKTVREAYEDARHHSDKEQFHFRRVGKPFIRRYS